MPNTYNTSIDVLRIIAGFGIVWAHMHAPYATLGHMALILFLILTATLSVRSLENSDKRYFLLKRTWRILVPWLAFCAFYKILQLAMAKHDLWAELQLNDPLSLLVGPTIHLWFLPFVLLASPLCVVAARLIHSRRDVVVGSALATILSLSILVVHAFGKLPEPFAQWTFAIPAYFYGILAAYGWKHAVTIAPLAFMATISAALYLLTGEDWAPQYLLAALLFEAAWRIPLASKKLKSYAQMVFGIYLIHPFFMLVVFKYYGPAIARPLTIDSAYGAILAYAMSATAVLVFQTGVKHALALFKRHAAPRLEEAALSASPHNMPEAR